MQSQTEQARLYLENGLIFTGSIFGHSENVAGEIIFVTNVVGYQEILTNPAYAGKIVVMTYPLIGNYGIILEDMESEHCKIKALVVREVCERPNNFRCEMELDGFLTQKKVMGLSGVDTRAIVKAIKNYGKMKAVITTNCGDTQAAFDSWIEQDWVAQITTKQKYSVGEGASHVGILDFGVTKSFIREFLSRNCKVTVFPVDTAPEDILNEKCDGLVLSDGAETNVLSGSVDATRNLLGRLPILGVGQGFYTLARACGLKVSPLAHGRHGSNHPVKDVKTHMIYITSQNAEFYVENNESDFETLFSNIADNTVAGLRHKVYPVAGFSFMPDSASKSCGTGFIYDDFIKYMEGVFLYA